MPYYSNINNNKSSSETSKTGTQDYIPKSIGECINPNPLADNLKKWSTNLESIGVGVAMNIALCGLVVSFIFVGMEHKSVDDEIVAVLIIGSLLKWSLYTFITYGICHTLSLLMNALASIVINTQISAKVALYTANNEWDEIEEVEGQKTNQSNPEDVWLKRKKPKFARMANNEYDSNKSMTTNED